MDNAPISIEAELVSRLRRGDVKAFDELYHRYVNRLFAFGFKYLKSKDETEELVQSVFLKLWETRETLKPESPIKSFLFTIAYNKICNIFRKKHYHREFLAEVLRSSPRTSPDLETSIEIRFFLDRVYELIDQLPEKQRAAFLKSRRDGKSSKEIAEELGVSSGSVDNYNADTLKFIRNYLKRDGLAVFLVTALLAEY